MATRATIAIQNEDYTVKSIYTHWDGYPAHMGKMMLNHYNKRIKVEELINMGNASSVYETIGEKHNFDGDRPKNQCTFYGRDRGDYNQEAQTHVNLHEYLNGRAQEGEYCYVFTKRGWYFGKIDGDEVMLQKLKKSDCVEPKDLKPIAY